MDFIATDHRDAQTLYQASLELHDAQTCKREVRALTTAMQETGIQCATIVSLDTEEQIETDARVIDVVPAWLWALQ